MVIPLYIYIYRCGRNPQKDQRAKQSNKNTIVN